MKKLVSLGIGIGVSFLIFGCADPEPQLPMFKPKALEAQGKGITVAKSTPYNCKALGEVEGKDDTQGTQGATRETLREGAINDLKNEAGNVVGENKRIMLKIDKEEVLCNALVQENRQLLRKVVKCNDGLPSNAIQGSLASHRIHADIFDCGEK